MINIANIYSHIKARYYLFKIKTVVKTTKCQWIQWFDGFL